MKVWPESEIGAAITWIEFNAPPADDEEEPRLYKVNASFLKSNYNCIWGAGCPSVLLESASSDGG